MNILALDLSLCHSGLCRDGESRVIDTSRLRGAPRLDHIVRQVQSLAGGAELAVIEGYSYGSAQGAHQIGELGGAVRLLLYRLGVPVVEVPPATLKKFATGRGNADKTAMVVAARERFGLTGTTNDNECDAFLLWAMARHHYGDPVASVPKAQADALRKVAWPAEIADEYRHVARRDA